jgi:hypothetical protein
MRDVKELLTNLLARDLARKLGLILTFLIPSRMRLCEKVYLMGKQFFHVSSRISSVSCKILFRVNRPKKACLHAQGFASQHAYRIASNFERHKNHCSGVNILLKRGLGINFAPSI